MEHLKTKVVLFLGAGFSAQSGLLKTNQLMEKLLTTPEDSLEGGIEEFISDTIKKFWEKVFAGKPSLEDHFTQIDMAAQSGHTLGRNYDSTKLQAIRRLTIHRIFSWLKNPEAPFPNDVVCRVVKHEIARSVVES
jgi:hypothetical protein